MKGGKKIGLKDIADYGSNPDTDDLADDSDLDTSTRKKQTKWHMNHSKHHTFNQ